MDVKHYIRTAKWRKKLRKRHWDSGTRDNLIPIVHRHLETTKYILLILRAKVRVCLSWRIPVMNNWPWIKGHLDIIHNVLFGDKDSAQNICTIVNTRVLALETNIPSPRWRSTRCQFAPWTHHRKRPSWRRRRSGTSRRCKWSRYSIWRCPRHHHWLTGWGRQQWRRRGRRTWS